MSPRVLVVDPDEALVNAVTRALAEAGYEPMRARDGLEALTALKKVRPELVITEFVLPRLEGGDLARALKARPETTDIPVIFVSEKTDPEALNEAKSLGAKKFLAKPFDIDFLVKTVRRTLKDKSSKDPG